MTAGRDESQLKTNILDYGVPSRERPVVREVTCAELRSGKVELAGKEVPVSPLSSFAMAREISETLKRWIEKGEFLLSEPVEPLSRERTLKPMRMVERLVRVKDLMTKRLITIGPDESLEAAATLIKQHNIDHLPVVEKDRLVGIVTSWDLAVSLGTGKKRVSEIMTRKVITANEEEPVDVVVRRLEQHKISGVPVVDGEGRLRGILTTDDISKFAVRR